VRVSRALAILVLLVAGVLASLWLAALADVAVAARPGAAAVHERARVLVTWRGYESDVETAGDVFAWQYTAPLMRLEYGDRSADGIRRMGFEPPPAAPCIGGTP
jgi:hypothetical protein